MPLSPHGLTVKISSIPKPKAAFTRNEKVIAFYFLGQFCSFLRVLWYMPISFMALAFFFFLTSAPHTKASLTTEPIALYLCRCPVVFGSFRHFGSRDMWHFEDCLTAVLLYYTLVRFR